MRSSFHVHVPNDGRGKRDVFLNGVRQEHVVYADTRRGIIRVVYFPIVLDKYGKRARCKTMRGNVEVIKLE